MLKRYERYVRVYSPEENGVGGDFLGYYPVAMPYRTSEEVESTDVLYANLRYTAYGKVSRAPAGGYRRGMTFEGDGGERYHVLVPVRIGRLWLMKVERVMCHGEGETYGRN